MGRRHMQSFSNEPSMSAEKNEMKEIYNVLQKGKSVNKRYLLQKFGVVIE